MPLRLTTTLKREILVDGVPHTVSIGPRGVKVTAKGFRKGRALDWADVLALGRADGPADGSADGSGAPDG